MFCFLTYSLTCPPSHFQAIAVTAQLLLAQRPFKVLNTLSPAVLCPPLSRHPFLHCRSCFLLPLSLFRPQLSLILSLFALAFILRSSSVVLVPLALSALLVLLVLHVLLPLSFSSFSLVVLSFPSRPPALLSSSSCLDFNVQFMPCFFISLKHYNYG